MKGNKVYYILDTLIKSRLKNYSSIKMARVSAEKLNQQYGCVRYVARMETI